MVWRLFLALWLLALPLQAREILSTPQEQIRFQQTIQEQRGIRLYLDLKRRQLEVRDPQGNKLKVFPVAVGRPGWTTPKGEFQILKKITNPTWEHIFTNQRFPAGQRGNPLGAYYLGFHTMGQDEFGFHGTNQPQSIGKAISHGCVRLFNKDIAILFPMVEVGTPLTVF